MPESRLNALYECFGYRKFKMSKFEPYDFYAENRDFLTAREAITFTDLDGTLLALKPDVTLSIVKSNGGGEEKVYYNEMVYRPKDRHYREILQAGIECIGCIDAYAEGEAIALAAKSLHLFSEDYVLRVSDAALLDALLSAWRLPDAPRGEVLSYFSAKNAEGIRGMQRAGRLPSEAAALFSWLSDLYLPFREGVEALFKRLVPYLEDTDGQAFPQKDAGEVSARLSALRTLSQVLEGFSVLPRVFLDFSVVNSMDYYNGILFQGALRGIPFTVLSGGRYDRLMEKMGKDVGAVGFALYLDSIEDYAALPKSYDVDLLLSYTGEEAASVPALMERLLANGRKVRAVRAEDLSHMEYQLRARERLPFPDALAKYGE